MKKITKESLDNMIKLDPKFKLLKAVCEDVFNRKQEEIRKEKPIYVVAIKAHGDAPALWVSLKDVEKFTKSKTIKSMLKV